MLFLKFILFLPNFPLLFLFAGIGFIAIFELALHITILTVSFPIPNLF